MEKIRSGQPYLYRKNGLNSTVIEVRMIDNINGVALNSALKKALKIRNQGFELIIDSEFSPNCGLGSSAAVTVALVAPPPKV